MSSSMPPPELIEILPLHASVDARITVPGSKSITNRALVLAALAPGATRLRGALWSEDTQVMVACLNQLGFPVTVTPDAEENCNRHITVEGRGGTIPLAGTAEKLPDLFVGNAGTAARFLSALVCLGQGGYRLSGVPRMHERPQAALFNALRELGYRIDSPNDRLPAVIHGAGPRSGKCTVSIEESSQFASALLLGGKAGGWRVKVVGENAEESPYVAMTTQLMAAFPTAGGSFHIEPDASSGSYFIAAEALLSWAGNGRADIDVRDWPRSGWQVDAKFRDYSRTKGLRTVSREGDLGDSIMAAIVLAPLQPGREGAPTTFTHLDRLRVQECDRVRALNTELTKCGARVIESRDTLAVFPGALHGAEIETYHDHRMAMCFAVLGLRVPGIKIRNPACVKKTFPDFFQKLAAAPPDGLGAVILDAATRQPLGAAQLFAD
jgi:3-phosphoshikimate 1-carboxyvinyltransferase